MTTADELKIGQNWTLLYFSRFEFVVTNRVAESRALSACNWPTQIRPAAVKCKEVSRGFQSTRNSLVAVGIHALKRLQKASSAHANQFLLG